ncbi:MAG: hypothetical protein DWP92_04985 [Armatimonadetes bacterium]|nr:MAG: hypothetical protein DWP92_04985 [Armatimonadota bacterium]
MDKVDFKKALKHLYQPSENDFSLVDVPVMQFIRIDGSGSPESESFEEAIGWLYATSYPIKFSSKTDLDRDYVVPPLEALWWADDMSAFTTNDRDAWFWTAMIMQPDWITAKMFNKVVKQASSKLGSPPDTLRFELFAEGLSVQILHVGPYADEAPTVARLHNEYLPDNGLVENGHHHEIYLSDPLRSSPEKLKTVIRQPVAHA